jgi:hypothetical protein
MDELISKRLVVVYLLVILSLAYTAHHDLKPLKLSRESYILMALRHILNAKIWSKREAVCGLHIYLYNMLFLLTLCGLMHENTYERVI